jgi:hypothetical protein
MSQDAIFSEEQARSLAAVLDELIPPEPAAGLPGAGALGLVDAIAAAIVKARDLEPAVLQGLAALDALARSRGADGFPATAPADRAGLLNQLAASQPAFLPGLIFPCTVSYYQHPRVMEALGLEGRPPHPKGYDMEPSDFSLLDVVRRRAPLFREV